MSESMLEAVLGLYNYWVVIFLMMTGFYIVISRGNLIKKVIGLNIFQASVFLMYITVGKVSGGQRADRRRRGRDVQQPAPQRPHPDRDRRRRGDDLRRAGARRPHPGGVRDDRGG